MQQNKIQSLNALTCYSLDFDNKILQNSRLFELPWLHYVNPFKLTYRVGTKINQEVSSCIFFSSIANNSKDIYYVRGTSHTNVRFHKKIFTYLVLSSHLLFLFIYLFVLLLKVFIPYLSIIRHIFTQYLDVVA